jgi:uncharacterized protein (TIGR00251 family)
MIDLEQHERGTLVRVRAQPNARKNGILGERGGALRVGVTVAPEKGKANQAIAAVLADAIGCRASALVLLSGETSRDKRFLLAGLDPDAVRHRLEPLLTTASH